MYCKINLSLSNSILAVDVLLFVAILYIRRGLFLPSSICIGLEGYDKLDCTCTNIKCIILCVHISSKKQNRFTVYA